MGSTTHLALPYPELSDTADVPRDIKALADKLDTTLTPGTWQTPTLTNAWSAPQSTAQAQYLKTANGVVFLRGWITGGTPGASAFTLPAGFRPTMQQSIWPVLVSTTLGWVAVGSDGSVVPLANPQTVSAWLNAIVFYAA